MTELPQGWEWSTVGELGEYINGRGFKKSEWSSSGRPIIRIQNLTGSGSAFNYFADELEDRYVVPTGALLVSWAATLGVYRWDGPEGALNQHIFRVRSFINEEFHRYLLEHALGLIQSHTHGSGMVHITRGRFDDTPAPVPPLPEQERIVSAIEEAVSKLDAGERGLRVVRQLLRRMRGAVLAAAVTGRLVRQDPSETPATKLLADLGIDEIEPTGVADLPDGWTICSLGSVSVLQEYGLSLKAHVDPVTGDVPMLRMGNIRGGAVDATDLKYVGSSEDGVATHLLEVGDLLFNRTNSFELVGKSAVYRGIPERATFASYLIRVRTVGAVEPEWCAAVINSQLGRRYIGEVAVQQVGQANVNGTKLKAFPLPLPPPGEQRRILAELDRQTSFIAACDRAVDAGLARSAALRRAVLKAAFDGQLVPQDPTDEPASALLERIRDERAVTPKAKSRRAGVEA